MMMFLGFTLNALAWTVLPGPTYSTLGLHSGLGFMFIGGLLFLINLLKN